jgi:hypothetical protein
MPQKRMLNPSAAILLALMSAAAGAYGQVATAPTNGCIALPKYATLKAALASA